MPLPILIAEKQIMLSPSQRRAAQYIMEHYDEAIFLTAARLADQVGVSEATIVRLAQVLGFAGYSEMQRKLRETLQERLTTVTRLEETFRSVGDGDGDILNRVMQEDLRNLTKTLQDISPETFHQAVLDILTARRIFVIGMRGAHAPALVLALYLRYLKKHACAVIPGYGDVWNTLYGTGSDDLVIGISFPRYTRLTVEILDYAHEQGARVGAVTDSLLSPLARNADWVLTVHSRLDSFIESFTAAMSLVNALLTAVSLQDPEETMKALKEREAIWREKEIYVDPYADPKKRKKKGT